MGRRLLLRSPLRSAFARAPDAGMSTYKLQLRQVNCIVTGMRTAPFYSAVSARRPQNGADVTRRRSGAAGSIRRDQSAIGHEGRGR